MSQQSHSSSQAENHEKKEGCDQKEVRFDQYRGDAERIVFEAQARDTELIDMLPSGEVSETVSEDRKNKSEPGGGTTSATGQQSEVELPQIEELRIPVEKMMIRQIRFAIQDEIKETQKIIQQLEKNPGKHAFELSKAVDMLRRLREVLSELAYKSAEYVKNLWLDVVQGKKIKDMLK